MRAVSDHRAGPALARPRGPDPRVLDHLDALGQHLVERGGARAETTGSRQGGFEGDQAETLVGKVRYDRDQRVGRATGVRPRRPRGGSARARRSRDGGIRIRLFSARRAVPPGAVPRRRAGPGILAHIAAYIRSAKSRFLCDSRFRSTG